MSKKPGFATAEPMELISKFTTAVYVGSPNELATILMRHKLKTYLVPVEVARMICKRLMETINHAEEVNLYKAEYGSNPKH